MSGYNDVYDGFLTPFFSPNKPSAPQVLPVIGTDELSAPRLPQPASHHTAPEQRHGYPQIFPIS